jgi:hypothetical protein
VKKEKEEGPQAASSRNRGIEIVSEKPIPSSRERPPSNSGAARFGLSCAPVAGLQHRGSVATTETPIELYRGTNLAFL